ncbi:MAG: type I glyceraldehyde-3-phosphate dehydrogenase [Jatrophihabitans sp.]|uniref:type I glyceraldehyde-3-phosphate dehydrogenase n=1 Tax=Jatrophihabitans sp. TaxID=1932789 RepID=UPI003F7ED2C4
MIRVGVNGLGRIGRAYLRAVQEDADIEVVAANDLADTATLARLMRHDSTFGTWQHEVHELGDALDVDGHKVSVTAHASPAEIAWGAHGVDVVIEATGRFRTREAAAVHLGSGPRKVVLSAPGKHVDATIVMGVNDDRYDPLRHHVISNASCTTNCVAPMVKVLDDVFGVQRGFMTTVHAYTNDQNVLDGPHKDPRRARSAAVNIIPTTTGAARAVGEVVPSVRGLLDGVALRVPVVDGSLVDLAVQLREEISVEDVNALFEANSVYGPLAGRVKYSTEPIVSSDVIGDPASCIFDAPLTQASGHLAKVFGWYDNEWGYTARLVELTRLVASS